MGGQIFLLWAVKGADYRFDDLLKTFSEVPWEEIAQRKPRYYSGLNWIMKAKKTILPKQFGTLFIFSID